MIEETLDLAHWVLPAVLLGAGILLGIVVEGTLLSRLRRLAAEGRWGWADVLLRSLRRMTFLLFFAAGAYGALLTVELPASIEALVRNFLVIIVIFAFTVIAARLGAGAVRTWARSAEGGIPASSLLENVARLLIFVLGVILILQNLGVEIGPLIAGLGIGGLAVALALQDTLGNLFSGFQIILARQIRTGDYISLEAGEEGYVVDIKWRNTTIKSRVEDHEVIIPNSTLATSIVTNYNLPAKAYWARLEVGVSYESDLERVERTAMEVARQVLEDEGTGDPAEPIVRFHGFGDSSIDFRVRVRIDEFASRFRIVHELVKRLHARFNEEGINIPFPIRTLYAPRGVEVRREAEGGGERPGRRS